MDISQKINNYARIHSGIYTHDWKMEKELYGDISIKDKKKKTSEIDFDDRKIQEKMQLNYR